MSLSAAYLLQKPKVKNTTSAAMIQTISSDDLHQRKFYQAIFLTKVFLEMFSKAGESPTATRLASLSQRHLVSSRCFLVSDRAGRRLGPGELHQLRDSV